MSLRKLLPEKEDAAAINDKDPPRNRLKENASRCKLVHEVPEGTGREESDGAFPAGPKSREKGKRSRKTGKKNLKSIRKIKKIKSKKSIESL